jgi:hypothetical protein
MSYRTRNCVVLLVAVLMLAGLPIQSFATKVRDVPPTPLLAPAGVSLADIAAAIETAAAEEGWIAVVEAPGVMRATLRVRTHKAVVTIGFDESNFWIKYRDSKNLNYNPDYNIMRAGAWEDGPSIHSNYNTWVEELAKSIEVSTIAPGSSNSTNTAPCANAILVADELEKLAALRERGILTQQEFDKQKSKLLAR